MKYKGIKKRIQDKGVTLRAFCKKADITFITLQRVDEGTTVPRRSTLARIKRAYNRLGA